MDISQTTVPDSTQVNAEDFLGGPRTVTVARVRQGTSEQPVNIELVEFPGRAYRPSKTMRRVLVMAWGKESDTWPTGARLTLYRDPEVKFGANEVGGIKISHVSHIDRPMTMALTVTRGKREPHVVQPLPDDAPQGHASSGGITPDHERVIRGHMQRAQIDGARVLELAQQAAGHAVKTARDLTSVEADALIVLLADLPDGGEEQP